MGSQQGNNRPNSTQESPLRRALEQPPLKRFKVDKYQDVGTLTDPESLGACEPGTAISLEGIVWNETKGGLLSLNLTWRGKSFVGTLLDCSTTDHGSQWTSPWHSDTLAPDQRPRKPRLAKKTKRRKKKGAKDKKEAVKDEDDENIDVDDDDEADEEEESRVKNLGAPLEREMVQCREVEGCGKKFHSESALQYHVSFAHTRIEKVKPAPPLSVQQALSNTSDNSKEETADKKGGEANNDVIRESEEEKKAGGGKSNGTEPAVVEKDSDPVAGGAEKQQAQQQQQQQPQLAPPPSPTSGQVRPLAPTPEAERRKQQKPFPSTLKIRPIVPAQPLAIPGMPGLALKPIQPKPTILPDPSPSLCLDDLRKVSKKKSPKQDGSANKSPSRGALENGGPKTKYQFDPKPLMPSPVGSSPQQPQPQQPPPPPSSRPEPVVIDLSRPSKPPTPPAPTTPQGPRPGSAEYYRMLEAYGFPSYPHPIPPGLDPSRHMQLLATDPGYRSQFEQSRAEKAREFKAQIDRDNKEKDLKTGMPARATPSPQQEKAHSPAISVRPEFKTGHLRDLKEGGGGNNPGRGSPYSRPSDQEMLAKLAMQSSMGASAMRDQELLAKLARQASAAGHNPMLSSLFASPPGVAGVPGLPPGWPQGLGIPPGLMLPPHATPPSPYNIPSMSPHPLPPTSASSFGSSLAALSRTAQSFVSRTQETEERRKAASIGPVTPPTRSPTTSNTSNTSSNPGVEGASPLLRHEHTHTHLHLGFNLSSPTHNS